MPIQTTYGFSYDKAQKGQITSTNADRDISAYSAAAIAFGIGVAYDGAATDESPRVKVPTAITDVLIGITRKVFKQATGVDNDFLSVVTSTTQGARYEIAEPITVRTLGEIWVFAEVAVNPSLPVFWRCVTNGGLTAGDFRTDADTNRAIAVPNARWKSANAAAGLALLELY
jgi:hypothetical protein